LSTIAIERPVVEPAAELDAASSDRTAPENQMAREPFGRVWRLLVAEGSMRPALEPGDWLLVDPTTRHWPRRGTIVVVHQPGNGMLVVKRVAARPGDTIRLPGSRRRLGPAEAWLIGDAPDVSIDSRTYGAVSLDHLVGRAWLRYGPFGRPLGPIGRPGGRRSTH
jgi:hypothetical protein